MIIKEKMRAFYLAMFHLMNNFIMPSYLSVCQFRKCEKGVTAMEYAIVVAGVASILSIIFHYDTGTVSKVLSDIFSKTEVNINANI